MLHSPPRALSQRRELTLLSTCIIFLAASVVVSAFSPPCRSCGIQRNSFHTIYSSQSMPENDSNDNDASAPASITASPVTVNPTVQPAEADNSPLKTGSPKVNSATLQFNNRLSRMAKNFDATTASKVEKLLMEAVEDYKKALAASKVEEDDDDHKHIENEAKLQKMITPNTVSFTNAITAWARCTQKESAKRAQALLDMMHSLYESDEDWEHVRPNRISYNSAITAWARSRERGSAKRAEEILRNMYDFYNTVLEKSGDDTAAAMDLKPDSRSWNTVINCVARSRDKGCADRAKFLLDEMGRLYDEGDDDLLPDALCFGAIINAYANSLEEGASDKASQLLLHMESLYQMGFEKAKPMTFVYNACMNAFAKDPLIGSSSLSDNSTSVDGAATMNRAEQAEQLLTSMEIRYAEEKDHRIMPDCISYSTVINAYANSNTPRSGINADAVLRRMISRYLLGDTKCRPNAVSFTAAIKAHSTAINATLSYHLVEDEDEGTLINTAHKEEMIQSSAKRCEDLLQELCLLYQNHGNDRSMKPTSVTLDLVTKALAQINDQDAVERVKLLRAAILG